MIRGWLADPSASPPRGSSARRWARPTPPGSRTPTIPPHGGLAQARHVFLSGNALPERWRDRDAFTILETGFGLGLNFLATWDALRSDPRGPARLHFVSVESHPFPAADLADALAPFEELRPLAAALVATWPPPIAGFHRLQFDGGRVQLTLLAGDARELLPQLEARADALFLDGFSPARNPDMWSPKWCANSRAWPRPAPRLATWTVAGGVRTALSDAGFRVEKREGFAHKREMLAGVRDGEPPAPARRSRRAVVVGAGLAGTMVAERLASRGWGVDLIDVHEKRTGATVGLVRPIANLRDAVNAQASRPAFLYALQHFRALQHDGYHLVWQRCGVPPAGRRRRRGGAHGRHRRRAGTRPGVPALRRRRRGGRTRRPAGARPRVVDALGVVGVARQPRRRAPRARRPGRSPLPRTPRGAPRAGGRRLARPRCRRIGDRRGSHDHPGERLRREAPAARGAPAPRPASAGR